MQLTQLSIALSVLIASISGKCENIRTRKELRQLTPTELKKFISATQKLQKQESAYDWYVDTHLLVGKKAHGVAAFLPWHRAFTVKYERELQKIDPSIVLPYWDWSIDAKHPERSVILSDKYLGGNGEKGTYCVKSGLAKNWIVRIPEKRCLKRDFRYGSKTGAMWDKSMIEAMICSNGDYQTFRQALEYNPHAIVHDNISHIWGDMNKMVTPNDPVFWMHHVMVDKIWWEWQQRDPKRLNEYFGFGATMSDNLWRLDRNVSSVMDTTSEGNCYTYERYGNPNVVQALQQSPLLQQQARSLSSEEDVWKAIESLPFSSIPEEFKATEASENAENNKIIIPDKVSGEMIKMNNLSPDGAKHQYERMVKFGALLNANPDFEPDNTL